MTYQTLFSGKRKKNISNCCLPLLKCRRVKVSLIPTNFAYSVSIWQDDCPQTKLKDKKNINKLLSANFTQRVLKDNYITLFFLENRVELSSDWNTNTTFWFVCVEVLQPSQPNGVRSIAVSLPNHTQGSSWSFQRGRSFATISGFQGEVLVQILDFPILSIHFHFSLSTRQGGQPNTSLQVTSQLAQGFRKSRLLKQIVDAARRTTHDAWQKTHDTHWLTTIVHLEHRAQVS